MRRALCLAATSAFGALMLAFPTAAAPVLGQPAPQVEAVTFDGLPFDLQALKGKVVVVSLWASWCPPCRVETPALEAVYRRYHGRGLEMIGLSADDPHDLARARAALAAASYPAALLAKARVNGFGAPRALPMTYVVDTHGVVRAVLGAGGRPMDEQALSAAVQPLIGG
jgi:peroxiredoxin